MTIPVPDPIAALALVLKHDAPLTALIAGRVFGGELPDSENDLMPRTCVVIRYTGAPGGFGGGYQQFGDVRVDATCYGATPGQAGQVWTAVRDALKQMPPQTQASTRLHWCRATGGPLSLRQSRTRWPYVLSVWQVLAGEVPVTT